MRKEIKFVNSGEVEDTDPVAKSRGTFRNITFKEEYRLLGLKFRSGLSWLRFLPRVGGSEFRWIMPIQLHKDVGGTTFLSPRTFDFNAPSVFEQARIWFKKNHPELLSNRELNQEGFNFWPKTEGIAWVIEEQAPEGERLRLFNRSLYDGIRGGTPGLAFNIKNEAESKDNEPGSKTFGDLVYGDITAPEAGRLVKIEKLPAERNEYANYKVGIGKNPAPIDHYMSLLTDDEVNMIVPLEETIHIPSAEEEEELLLRYIGAALFAEMTGKSRPLAMSREPEPTPEKEKPKATVKPEPEPEPEPTVKPVTKSEPEAEPVTPSDVEAGSETPYTTKEVTKLLGREKEGVEILLQNKHRLNAALLDIVIDSAKEYDLPV